MISRSFRVVYRKTFGPLLLVKDEWLDDNRVTAFRHTFGSRRCYLSRYGGPLLTDTIRPAFYKGHNFNMWAGKRWTFVLPWFERD